VELHDRGYDPQVVHLGRVLELQEHPDLETVLLAYCRQPVACRKAAEVLYGTIEAKGSLPIAVPDHHSN
jgi:hypothetical protein